MFISGYFSEHRGVSANLFTPVQHQFFQQLSILKIFTALPFRRFWRYDCGRSLSQLPWLISIITSEISLERTNLIAPFSYELNFIIKLLFAFSCGRCCPLDVFSRGFLQDANLSNRRKDLQLFQFSRTFQGAFNSPTTPFLSTAGLFGRVQAVPGYHLHSLSHIHVHPAFCAVLQCRNPRLSRAPRPIIPKLWQLLTLPEVSAHRHRGDLNQCPRAHRKV